METFDHSPSLLGVYRVFSEHCTVTDILFRNNMVVVGIDIGEKGDLSTLSQRSIGTRQDKTRLITEQPTIRLNSWNLHVAAMRADKRFNVDDWDWYPSDKKSGFGDGYGSIRFRDENQAELYRKYVAPNPVVTQDLYCGGHGPRKGRVG